MKREYFEEKILRFWKIFGSSYEILSLLLTPRVGVCMMSSTYKPEFYELLLFYLILLIFHSQYTSRVQWIMISSLFLPVYGGDHARKNGAYAVNVYWCLFTCKFVPICLMQTAFYLYWWELLYSGFNYNTYQVSYRGTQKMQDKISIRATINLPVKYNSYWILENYPSECTGLKWNQDYKV